ncbi:hypothetical protein [Marinoscillum pacificum]|uniref:hypothetical protein n=1 Tax=Marinoscillum pacificum TaxID=392723 RepID=UPI002157F122|nr:hypothetical protein [Marinoscillum pacificum]
MRPFSDNERHIVRSLVNGASNVVSLIDFIRPGWGIEMGKLEMSSYQQLLVVHASGTLNNQMSYLLEVMDLISYLEKRGYVSSWQSLPMVDNTVYCGERSDGVIPQFLPDIAVSAKLLSLASQQFRVNHSLQDLVNREFISLRSLDLKKFKNILIGGCATLILVNAVGLYFNYQATADRLNSQLRILNDRTAKIGLSQMQQQETLDSVMQQSREIADILQETTNNTQRLEEVRNAVSDQSHTIRKLSLKQAENTSQVKQNFELLKRVDSVQSQ